MIKIIIADDHIVLRQGLRSIINNTDDWSVVAEASDGFEAVSLVEEHQPQILILDLSMPSLGGLEALARLQKTATNTKILVLSVKDDEFSVSQAMESGASGFLPKTASVEELQFAIKALVKGQTYLSPAVCAKMLAAQRKDEAGNASPLACLTPREREVMKLLSQGLPNRQVAKTLHISARTIDSHRANIMKKLSLGSNSELVQMAIRCGVIE